VVEAAQEAAVVDAPEEETQEVVTGGKEGRIRTMVIPTRQEEAPSMAKSLLSYFCVD